MRIGTLTLDNSAVLAPLAGITDLPFRLLVKRSGCGLVYSEMISANALVRRSAKTLKMLVSCEAEKPLCIQIFGADPEVMAEAARMVEAAGADLVDINFGCSVKKIVKSGAGVALMRDTAAAGKLLDALRRAVSVPLTIKIRSGWDASGRQALAIARVAEDCGVAAIAVHPRTAGQGFRGSADWSIIAAVKAAIAIPVIGNGDILSARDALRMESETGCDGVMIGRAAIGNPWLFEQYLALKKDRPAPSVDLGVRLETMARYVREMIAFRGELQACRMLRSRLGWFVKGLPHAGAFRDSIRRIASEGEALAAIAMLRSERDRRAAEADSRAAVMRNTPPSARISEGA